MVRETVGDDRLCDNPLVTNDPYICFYTGASILAADGFALGTVCALGNLLNFVRIDHAHLELRPIDLDRVIQGVGADCADAIARCGASVAGFSGELPTFETGAGALNYLGRADPGVPCVIFLDINMPGMDGFEFAAQTTALLTDEPTATIKMLTSSGSKRDRLRASSIPIITEFMTKPLPKSAIRLSRASQ